MNNFVRSYQSGAYKASVTQSKMFLNNVVGARSSKVILCVYVVMKCGFSKCGTNKQAIDGFLLNNLITSHSIRNDAGTDNVY